MSDDLISRKELERAIRAYADGVGCNRGEYELANGILKSLSVLNDAPTVYDVENVIEKLNEYAFYMSLENTECKAVWIGKAIDIVKGGGIDD